MLVFKWRTEARAAANSAGGKAVVKMNDEAKLRTASMIAGDETI